MAVLNTLQWYSALVDNLARRASFSGEVSGVGRSIGVVGDLPQAENEEHDRAARIRAVLGVRPSLRESATESDLATWEGDSAGLILGFS